MFSTISCTLKLSASSLEVYGLGAEIEEEVILELERDLKAKSQNQPIFVLIAGYQGAGKSSLISRIHQVYDTNVISLDVIRQTLFNKKIDLSPEFNVSVKNISKILLKKALENNTHILFDANAHSKQIEEIEKLLQDNTSPHRLIKIFLDTSPETLKKRVRDRKPTEGCYQGTEHELANSLLTKTINELDYHLKVPTDNLSKAQVFEIVNSFIFDYFNQ